MPNPSSRKMCNRSEDSNSNSNHKEEEYVDYSCSTAVERLTRDVESLLRSWHVHDGCDRHFSVKNSKTNNPKSDGLTLLRAERFTWIAAIGSSGVGRGGGGTIRMELELALWDGPPSKKYSAKKTNGGTNELLESHQLPKRRLSMSMKRRRRRDRRRRRNRRQTITTCSRDDQRQEQSFDSPASTPPMKNSSSSNRRSSLSNDECVGNIMKNMKQSIVQAVCKDHHDNQSINTLVAEDDNENNSNDDEDDDYHAAGSDFELDRSDHSVLSGASLPLRLGYYSGGDELDDDDSDDDYRRRHPRGENNNKLNEKEEEAYNNHHLPKSLRRPHHPADITDMPDSLFDNFSTMFGIGQHITLTPTNPSIDLGIVMDYTDDDDVEIDTSITNNNNRNKKKSSKQRHSGCSGGWSNNNNGTISNLCNSLLGRHKPRQGRWVLTQLLASWLQSALNCAAMNCQSCIPVFAIWGNYPSAALPSEELDLDQQQQQDELNNSIASCYYWNNNNNNNNHHTNNIQQRKRLKEHASSIPIFPPWLDAAQAMRDPMAHLAKEIKARHQQQESARNKRNSKKRSSPKWRGGGGKNNNKKGSSPSNKSRSFSSQQPDSYQQQYEAPICIAEPSILNNQNSPTVVCGSVIPTTETHANFTCSVLPHTLLEGPLDRLSTWGDLLLRHCSSSSSSFSSSSSGSSPLQDWDDDQPSVVLSGARHVYSWSKAKIPPLELEAWRGIDPKDYWKQQLSSSRSPSEGRTSSGTGNEEANLASSQHQQHQWNKAAADASFTTITSTTTTTAITTEDEVNDYIYACRARALDLLEQSVGKGSWGPRHDPIYALQASVGWKSQIVVIASDADDDSDDDDEQQKDKSQQLEQHYIEPLGSFPSPTQCSAYCSSLLDPQRASFFKVQTFLDQEALEPTLGTAQRCTLACLIRTSTLSPLTLLRHLLWEEDIIEDWDHNAGNRSALRVARKAQVGEATKTLVDVMDWKTCAEEMISEEDAIAVVNEVLEGTSSFVGFPSPPEDMFLLSSQQHKGRLKKAHPLIEPFFHSAPVGRLVSDLCARMARLRTPCSMALVWAAFCRELRERWDVREPLSRMDFVAGLDPSPAVLAERRKLSTIGVKADLAAFLNCSEPDPDVQHCLIGQKLQVFNIGIEMMAVMEENLQQQGHEDSMGEEGSQGATDLVSDPRDGSNSPTPARANSLVSLASDGHPSPKEPELDTSNEVVSLSSFGRLQMPSYLFKGTGRNQTIIDGLLPMSRDNSRRGDEEEEKEDVSTATGGTDNQTEFFDPEDCGMTVFTSRSIFSKNVTTTAVHRIERKGARAPIHGCSLVASGDQVYAPYLRRPEPLTDDVILERRMMLSEENFISEMTANDGRTPIQRRLEIAYRLQKPKLLSDMNAFKAANPGAVFQDFVSWYGNPGNPLDDYCSYSKSKLSTSSHNGLASSSETIAMKLDKATEAIHILNETRNFWSNTWDEADSIPASEQKPLYEVLTTVEMTLDYLERMHPAILLNQIMAVTLANSYFLLVASAKDAVRVPVIERALGGLRQKMEHVLEKLAEEASNATRAFHNMQCDDSGGGEENMNKSFVSVGVINKCERLCSCLSEAEVLVSLATSLLHKFPEQYDTVECILQHADGEKIELQDPIGQSRILNAIADQQEAAAAASHQTQQTNTPTGDNDDRVPQPVLREYLLRNLDDSSPCQLSVRYGDSSLCRDKGSDSSAEAGLLVALTKSYND